MSEFVNQTTSPAPIKMISIGVVAYNEETALPGLFDEICAQTLPHNMIEIVLVNSASNDATRSHMEQFATYNKTLTEKDGFGFANVCVLDNPAKVQAAGWNVAIENFSGDALVRVDAHASIPENFLASVVEVLNEGEYVCGGMRPTTIAPGEETPWRYTLYLAEESAFGSSVADYRRECKPRYVDSLFHAAYRMEVFDAVGKFNEELLRTEDNDFHFRVRSAGFRIKLDPRINSMQFVRSSLSGMLKQKYGNGYWVGRTVFVQPKCLEWYHFAPFVLVLAAVIELLLGIFATWVPFVVCALLYIAACVALSVRSALSSVAEKRCIQMLALPFVFICIHVSYGIGTFAGLIAGVVNILRK
jgi:glycosyltransferase involved in cell wall biosynthesis